MKLAPLIVYALLSSGCAHQPTRIAWSHIELGHSGGCARAQIEAVLDRACTLVVTANGEAPRRTSIEHTDCDGVLAMAANRASHAPAPCTVTQQFIAGVAVTLDDGRTTSACWDDELASRMAALGDKLAPDWRRGPTAPASCDFTDDKIEGDLVAPPASR